MRGTTKVAILKDDPAVKDLLSISVYDTKHVHMLSTIVESVKWIPKKEGILYH